MQVSGTRDRLQRSVRHACIAPQSNSTLRISFWQRSIHEKLALLCYGTSAALEQLTVPYHIGGSVASSLYGEFRPTQDVDIVADMQLAHVRLFVRLLED